MPSFHYTATDESGTLLEGLIQADTRAHAFQLIEQLGLKPQTVAAAAPAAVPQKTLNYAESVEVVEKIVAVAETSLPVATGLRAAADDAQQRSVARALRAIAGDIERGVPLSAAVGTQAVGFPRFLRGLVAAASHTGQLAITLEACLTLQSDVRRVWRALVMSLIYPLIILAMVTGVMVVLFVFVVPDFKIFFEEFQLELPALTVAMFRISDTMVLVSDGARTLVPVGVLAGFVVVVLSLKLAIGKANWRWLMGTLPLIGPLWSWSSAAAFARVLGVLVDHQLPLQKALALTQDGIADANVQAACREFASEVAAGSRLSTVMANNHRLPRSLVPFVQAGEEHGELPESLRMASEIFFERLRLRSLLLQSVSPPIVFILVAMTIMMCIVGLVLPLFDLISGLA